MNTETIEGFYSVPIRRTRWTSFWIGVVAVVVAFMLAAALAAALVGLLVLLKVNGGGVVIILVFGVLWFGLFFLSYPLQRRYARSLDLRRPGIRLADGVLAVPSADDSTLQFKLDEPHELSYGWWETLVTNITGPTLHVRVVVTYATLSQAGHHLFLIAEDSTREAKNAGWLKSAGVPQSKPAMRLWAEDIVALVEAMRTRPGPTMPEHQPNPTTEEAAPEAIREWPENPLRARNRHEVLLFLERQKAEVVSRSAVEGGEVILGRTPELLFRFVFVLLEDDPEDENDFGSGVSRILNPLEIMFEVEKLERAGHFGTPRDAPNDAARALTYKTTREIADIRRLHMRAIALIDQVMRFAQADGWPAEDSFQTKTARILYQRRREQFHVSALKARQQALRENLKFWELPVTNSPQARRQAVLIEALGERCPDYFAGLQQEGFESEHIRHPEFSHSYHLTRFAARALQQGKPEQARAAFDAWMIAQPNDLLFPTREFAEAIYEFKVELATAMPFVPMTQQNYLGSCYQREVDPDYNPWGY